MVVTGFFVLCSFIEAVQNVSETIQNSITIFTQICHDHKVILLKHFKITLLFFSQSIMSSISIVGFWRPWAATDHDLNCAF